MEIWIAGTNDITVERAGRLGDGWLTAQNATDEALVDWGFSKADVAKLRESGAVV